MDLNVFADLAKYNKATSENYLTESLVFVMRLLLERNPVNGLKFVNLIGGKSPKNDGPLFRDAKSVSIATQIATEVGTPDIEIRDKHSLVYVEVKHDSPLGAEQLERYKEELEKSETLNTHLVLLTRSRYSFIETTLEPADYSRVYWYEIYNWLSESNLQDEVSQYLVESLMKFLDEKRMSLKFVKQDYVQGIPALLNLTDMLKTAIIEVMPGIKIINTGGWNWRGFYLPNEYWFGIRYSKHLVVTFENNRGYDPVTYRCSLDLMEVSFFSMDKDEQFECLVDFLRTSTQEISFSD